MLISVLMRDYVGATVITGITHPLQFISRAGIMAALVIRPIISIQSPRPGLMIILTGNHRKLTKTDARKEIFGSIKVKLG